MLDFILLGMLREDASGYELKARFEKSAVHFWSADQSQIYRTLKRMETKGWLRSRTEASPDGPDRRIFARTEAGAGVLEAWLREEPEMPVLRQSFVGQLFYMGELDDLEETIAFLGRLREELRARVAALETLEVDIDDIHDLHASLSLELGLAVARARLEWCERAVRRVRSTTSHRKKT